MRTKIPATHRVRDPWVTAAPRFPPEIQTELCASPPREAPLPSAIPACRICFLSLSSLPDCSCHTAQRTAAPRLGSVIKQLAHLQGQGKTHQKWQRNALAPNAEASQVFSPSQKLQVGLGAFIGFVRGLWISK